jgi:hypothetical protein
LWRPQIWYKFEVPVMYSTAIPEPLLRYT